MFGLSVLFGLLKNRIFSSTVGTAVTGLFGSKSTLIAMLISLLVGAYGAYWIMDTHQKAERTEVAEKALQREQQIRQEVIDKYEKVAEISTQRELTLIQQLNDIKLREKSNPEEVKTYVKDNPECNLLRGTVSLLNDTRVTSGIAGLPQTPTLTDAEKRTASTVTQREEIQYHAQCRAEYSKVSARCNQLIDWFERVQSVK